MARGDKKKILSSEKEAPSLASTALDNLPVDAGDRRRDLVDYVDNLEKEKKEAANEYAAHEKHLTESLGLDKWVQAAFKKLRRMPADTRARALRQLFFLIKDFSLSDPQGNLFNDDGQPAGIVKDKEKPVFDATANKAAPRDNVREPEKKLTGAEPPKHVPSEGIPLEEAQAKFEENKAKGDAARAKKDSAPKPPTAKKAETENAPRPPSKKATAAEPEKADPKPPKVTRLSREPTEDELRAVKAKADKYIPKPDAKPDDADDAPGTYQVH